MHPRVADTVHGGLETGNYCTTEITAIYSTHSCIQRQQLKVKLKSHLVYQPIMEPVGIYHVQYILSLVD